MSHYKIKLEDKAAFLNRLEKQDIHIGSYDITDNKYEGYFEVDINDESDNDIIKSMLNKSPKINTIKEMKQQITKTQLKQIIREELGKMKGQKNKLNEDNSIFFDLALNLLKHGGSTFKAFVDPNMNIAQQAQALGDQLQAVGGAGVIGALSVAGAYKDKIANAARVAGSKLKKFGAKVMSEEEGADTAAEDELEGILAKLPKK